MMHPGEGTLQALLDREVHPIERGELERHLDGCGRCSAELDALRESSAMVSQALGLLWTPVDVERARWQLETRRRRGPTARGAGVLRRAALLVVGSAAVLSATVPGSPVRTWIVESWERATASNAESGAPVVVPVAAPADVPRTGVSVLPERGSMRVVLTGPAEGVQLRVRLYDGERVGVQASGAAANARFRTTPDRIEIEGAGPGELRIELPRSAARLSVEVNGRVYLSKEGEQLRLPGPVADTVGPEIFFEIRP